VRDDPASTCDVVIAQILLEALVELIVVIIILLLLFGSFPHYGYSRSWGYFPSGTLGTILLIFLILWLLHVV
jgi:hypothetical protein